jgi:hypothetical protein
LKEMVMAKQEELERIGYRQYLDRWKLYFFIENL